MKLSSLNRLYRQPISFKKFLGGILLELVFNKFIHVEEIALEKDNARQLAILRLFPVVESECVIK